MVAIGEQGLRWVAEEKVDTRADAAQSDIAALVIEHSPVLYRLAFSVLRTATDAEDVVQETFLRVIEDLARFARVREPRPWLMRIAWNLALDRKRRRPLQQADAPMLDALVSSAQSADKAVADAHRLAQTLAVIDRLARREREVLLLAAVEELTTAEIAAVLKKSESSVRSLLFRARAHLQQRLDAASQRPRRGGKRT